MGPKHNLSGRGCYYATFRTFGKWKWKSECCTAREKWFHLAWCASLMQKCCPADSLSVKTRTTMAMLMLHGSRGETMFGLPSNWRVGFCFFWPIAMASVADNSHHNNTVMNAFIAQLSAGRPGWCWALCCSISRAPQTAVQTLWILEVSRGGIDKLLNVQKKTTLNRRDNQGWTHLYTVKTGVAILQKL